MPKTKEVCTKLIVGTICIRQSGRKIESRIKEHEESIRDKRPCTGFTTPCIQSNQKFDANDIKVHHKSYKLNLHEQSEKAPKSGDQVDNFRF